jgi:hypothetical protein
MKRLRDAVWPVLLVTGGALASSAVMSGADADHLDPAVWQAIVERPDVALPVFHEPVNGEI